MFKSIVTFTFLVLFVTGAIAQADKKSNGIDSLTFSWVDKAAEFPGGETAMFQFLNKNLVYPVSAKEEAISGKCYMQFVVSKEGLINNVKVLRGVQGCPECDQECIRVIKSMPNWTPALKDDQPVNSYYNLPFVFSTN